jgi:peptide/nickel transport system permease protein
VAHLYLRAGAPWGARTLGGMLPAACVLALAETVKLARYQRSALLDALAADYVVTARAKGHGAAGVVAHALRNALLPTVTLVGSELPALVSAAVIVEQVFGLHGIGMMAFDAVMTRDVPLLLGITTVGAVITLAAVLAADVAYGLVDPRLRGKSA